MLKNPQIFKLALKEGRTIVEVSVKDNNVEGALRILKKKDSKREGIFKEMKMRTYFEKPSQKKFKRERLKTFVAHVKWLEERFIAKSL